jgi:hypothetical protein
MTFQMQRTGMLFRKKHAKKLHNNKKAWQKLHNNKKTWQKITR